jgi:methylenetetrahydrofolate dehydrogenase (NADP+)/methenyltetrahydrofolate cyclohydrolase
MIQIPVPHTFDRDALITAITPEKDIDGLRYCLGIQSRFIPPVILSILQAIDQANLNLHSSNIVIIGKGFLVGSPLQRYFKDNGITYTAADSKTVDLRSITSQADLVISAVGKANLITADMVRSGVTIIDAGTSEVNGQLKGDCEEQVYKKAAFYTPVPGSIGPLTVGILMKNVLRAYELENH